MALDFACGRTRLMDIQLHAVRSLKSGRLCVTGLTVDGQLVIPSRDFWNNLFRRFGLDNAWADRKSDARRFEWLAVHFAAYEIPYRMDWDETGQATLYPCPNKKLRRPRRRATTVPETNDRRPLAARLPRQPAAADSDDQPDRAPREAPLVGRRRRNVGDRIGSAANLAGLHGRSRLRRLFGNDGPQG